GLRGLASRADDEQAIARDCLARGRHRAIRFGFVEQHRFARRPEDDEAVERARAPLRERRGEAPRVDAILVVERRRHRSEHTFEIHRIDSTPVLRPCSARLRPKTTTNIATAGLSSHGKSTNTRTFDASCSIVPQLGIGSENPRPMNDSVASATTNAGTSIVSSTPTKPPAAGRRCRPRSRAGPAPSARAATAYSRRLSARTIARTPRATNG